MGNFGAISFIRSRRRIHFGTSLGECQLTINSGVFQAASYEQYIIRSNSSPVKECSSGDGKIFYIANKGRELRFISTEDKDYESIDGLLSTALEGLDLKFDRIGWLEKISSVIALTEDKRLFFITAHADTDIKAITEFKCELPIHSFCTSDDNLYVIVEKAGYLHVCRYGIRQDLSSLTIGSETEFPGDFAVVHPNATGAPNVYRDIYPFYLGQNIMLFHGGVEYTIAIPLGYTGDPTTITLPVNPSLMTEENPGYFYGQKVKVKLRTMPFADGAAPNSAVGDIHRVDRLSIQFDKSGPCKAGVEGGTIYDVEGLSLTSSTTKMINFDMPQSPDIENHFYLETDKPTPLHISGISYRGVSYSGE